MIRIFACHDSHAGHGVLGRCGESDPAGGGEPVEGCSRGGPSHRDHCAFGVRRGCRHGRGPVPTKFNLSSHRSSGTNCRHNLNGNVHAQHFSGILRARACREQCVLVFEFKSFAHSFKVRIVNKVHEIEYLADQKIERLA